MPVSQTPSVLPDYTPDVVLDPAMARQDRISIVLGDWTLRMTDVEARNLPLQCVRAITPPGREPIRLFNGPSGRSNKLKFDIKSRRGPRGGILAIDQPTFSGHLEVRRLGPDPFGANGEYRWQLRAVLTLNPTTWVAHLGTRQILVPVDEWEVTPHRALAQQIPDYHWERPLVPASNVVVGTARHLALLRAERWPGVVRNYLRSVWAAIDTVIEAALVLPGANHLPSDPDLTRHPYIAIKETETYWEFRSPHPLQEMARLEAQLRALVAVSQIGWAEIEQDAGNSLPALANCYAGTDHNSPCLRIKLAKGTFLRVYAKTTSRIRFEVVHKKTKGQKLFRQGTSDTHTDHGEARLAAWLTGAAGSATDLGNALLSRMRENASAASQEPQKRPHELVGDIYHALVTLPLSRTQPGDDPGPVGQRDRERKRSLDTAREIVEQLVCNGRIALGPNDPQRPAVIQLTGRGILQRSGHEGTTHVYVVTASYHSALARLRDSEST